MKKTRIPKGYFGILGSIVALIAMLVSCAGPPAKTKKPAVPIEIGKRGPVRSFTAATWNVRQLTSSTAQITVSILPANGNNAPKKKDAIFALLDKFSIEIVALQEVHESHGTFPLGNQNGFTLIKGKKIVENINLGPEFCPVAYKEVVFNCSDYGTGWESGGRKIHWVKCTFDAEAALPAPQKKKFYFGCTHFGTGVETNPNIIALFRYLDNSHAASTTPALPHNKTPARPVVKKGVQKDNFILGLDANSYRYGMKQTIWRRAYHRWQQDNAPVSQDIVLEEIRPTAANGGFTKFSKSTNAAGVQQWQMPAQRARIVDELVWSLDHAITYVPDSKQIVAISSLRNPTRYPVAHRTLNTFMVEFHKLSDHLPVIAEFRY